MSRALLPNADQPFTWRALAESGGFAQAPTCRPSRLPHPGAPRRFLTENARVLLDAPSMHTLAAGKKLDKKTKTFRWEPDAPQDVYDVPTELSISQVALGPSKGKEKTVVSASPPRSPARGRERHVAHVWWWWWVATCRSRSACLLPPSAQGGRGACTRATLSRAAEPARRRRAGASVEVRPIRRVFIP